MDPARSTLAIVLRGDCLSDGRCSSSGAPTSPTRRLSRAAASRRRGRRPAQSRRERASPPPAGAASRTTGCVEPYGACSSLCRSNPTSSGHGPSSASNSNNSSLSSCRHGNSSPAPVYRSPATGTRYVAVLPTQ